MYKMNTRASAVSRSSLLRMLISVAGATRVPSGHTAVQSNSEGYIWAVEAFSNIYWREDTAPLAGINILMSSSLTQTRLTVSWANVIKLQLVQATKLAIFLAKPNSGHIVQIHTDGFAQGKSVVNYIADDWSYHFSHHYVRYHISAFLWVGKL